MQRRTLCRRRTPFSILVAMAVALATCVAFAAAAAPEADSTANATRSWKGRFCTQPGCTGSAETAPWGQAAGFGVAVVVTGVLARRRN
jgi:MYXO-CTERM domain-containing protein